MHKYNIRKIVHQQIDQEWNTDDKAEARRIFKELYRLGGCYPLLVVNGTHCTIAQAERELEISNQWGGGDDDGFIY